MIHALPFFHKTRLDKNPKFPFKRSSTARRNSAAVGVGIVKIAVSMPVFYATKSRVRGFWAALGSGLAEPCGALLCFFVLRRFISNAFLDGLVALIAGLMCFVCYSELIPGSLQYKQNKAAVLGMAVGTVVMGAGIWLFGA